MLPFRPVPHLINQMMSLQKNKLETLIAIVKWAAPGVKKYFSREEIDKRKERRRLKKEGATPPPES